MSDELRECPFCASKARLYDFDLSNGEHEFAVECLNDSCASRTGAMHPSADECIAAWNRRTDIETGEDYDKSFAELTVAYNLKCAEADALRAERDAALAELAKPREDWREDWQASFDSLTAEYDKQFARADAALAEAAKYKALWESVPWDAIRTAAAFALVDPYFAGGPPDPIEFQVRIVEGWLADHAPEPPDKEPQP